MTIPKIEKKIFKQMYKASDQMRVVIGWQEGNIDNLTGRRSEMTVTKTEKKLFKQMYEALDQMDKIVGRMEENIDILNDIAEEEEREKERQEQGTTLSLV